MYYVLCIYLYNVHCCIRISKLTKILYRINFIYIILKYIQYLCNKFLYNIYILYYIYEYIFIYTRTARCYTLPFTFFIKNILKISVYYTHRIYLYINFIYIPSHICRTHVQVILL